MPVTAEQTKAIEQYVDELGLEGDARTNMIATIVGNEKAAVQFIGQRTRHVDYTKKTQDLAKERESLVEKEKAIAATVQEYAAEAQRANDQAAKVIESLKNERITAATAAARIDAIKEKYGLTDEELPSVTVTGTVTPPKDAGKDGKFDEEALVKRITEQISGQLLPHLTATMQAPGLVGDISDEHKQLTGKRLTSAELNELLADAAKNRTTLVSAWESKYKIGDLRQTKWQEAERVRIRQEVEDRFKAERSEEALNTVRGRHDQTVTDDMSSPVVGREYGNRSGEVVEGSKGVAPKPAPLPQQKVSGAQRAAEKWVERRSQGVPVGGPVKVDTKVA